MNQQVPATDQIDVGERRVHHDVLTGKDAHLPDTFVNAVAALALEEETAQAFRRVVGEPGSLPRWDHKARRVRDERTEVPF